MPVQAAATLWTEVLDRLRSDAPGLYRDWFYDLSAGDLEHGILAIRPRNRHQAAYLTSNCVPRLAETAQVVTGRLVTVRVLEPDDAVESEPPAPEPVLNPEFTFDRFHGCLENQLALSAALAVAESPSGAPSPLLFIGPSGTGKTHLLQAIVHKASQSQSVHSPKCRYRAAEAFVAEFMQAAEEGTEDRFRDAYTSLDLLLLDDVDYLAGRELSQEALFHIFVSLADGGRQIVLASRRMPQEIAGLAPRLATRFSSGLVAPLEALCLESRVSMLRKFSAERGLLLAEAAVRAVAERTSTPGDLVAAVDRLVAASASRGMAVEAEFACRVLESRPGVGAEALLRSAAARFDVSSESLTQRRRSRTQKMARELAMFLVQQHSALTVSETADLFEIPTVELMDVLRRVGLEVSGDPKLSALLDEIATEAKNAAV